MSLTATDMPTYPPAPRAAASATAVAADPVMLRPDPVATGSATALESLPPIETLKETVIKARPGWIAVDWREVWSHRELLYFMVWRDVKVRYKQAVLGLLWAVLNPVLQVALFTYIFGRHASGTGNSQTKGLPMSVFIFAAMIPWQFIARAIGEGGMSLVSQQNLLSKIYLPRLFIPLATIGGALVDACISFTIFVVWMFYAGVVPSWQVVFLPLLAGLTVLTATSLALFLSAVTITFRDLRFILPFMVQIGMFVSAVVWPVDQIVPRNQQWVLYCNPLFGLFEAYRSCISGTEWRPGALAISVAFTAVFLTFSLFYFRKTERRFADIA